MTPVSRSASPAVANPSASAPRKSTPAKPFTCRSTKPGHGDSATDTVEADGLHQAAVDRDVSRDEAAVHERCLDAEPHGVERLANDAAGVLEPRSRGRGVRRGEQHHDRDLRVAPGRVERCVDLLRRRARGERHDPPHAGPELLVRRDDVDHQVAERLADADHRDRRDRVQHELLRGPRLEACRARENLCADDDGDLVVCERAERRAADTDDRHGQRADTLRFLERREDVGRAAAGADADDRVGIGDGESA